MKQGGKIQSFFLYTLSIQVSSISNIIDAEQECVAFTQKRLKHVSVLFGWAWCLILFGSSQWRISPHFFGSNLSSLSLFKQMSTLPAVKIIRISTELQFSYQISSSKPHFWDCESMRVSEKNSFRWRVGFSYIIHFRVATTWYSLYWSDDDQMCDRATHIHERPKINPNRRLSCDKLSLWSEEPQYPSLIPR